MYLPWHAAMMLALESNSVIGLRLEKLGRGGHEGIAEAHLMVSEKLEAVMEACSTLMMGGTVDTVIDRYREHVAANEQRLSGL